MNTMCTVNIAYIFPIDCSVKLYLKLAAILDYSFTHEKKQGSFMYGLIPNSSVDCKNFAQPTIFPHCYPEGFSQKKYLGGTGTAVRTPSIIWGTTTRILIIFGVPPHKYKYLK